MTWVTIRSLELCRQTMNVRLNDGERVDWWLDGVLLPPAESADLQSLMLALGEPVSLNIAAADDLIQVPGIGSTLAGRIVTDRAKKGCFRRISDLDRVAGFGPKTVARVAPFLSVGRVKAEGCETSRGG